MSSHVIYVHIPKTAGSSINRFFSQLFQKQSETHIESRAILKDQTSDQLFDRYRFLSGHIAWHAWQKAIGAHQWDTICTLRDPIQHIASHISWVRLLGEPEQKSRLKKHNDSIQKIVHYLCTLDLSQPEDILKLQNWLVENQLMLFHNTQTRYLCGGKAEPEISQTQLKTAQATLDKIHFVGIAERLQEFMLMLASTYQMLPAETLKIYENSNQQRFGLDTQMPETQDALLPFIKADKILFEQARKRFIGDFHQFLADLEMRAPSGFSHTNVEVLFQHIKKSIQSTLI